METGKLIFVIIVMLALLSAFIVIGLMFFIGKTRIKAIDKVVYGFGFPNESIFALLIRVPNYGGAFLWKWSARRSGLEGKIEHFDETFRWPFKAVILLTIFGITCSVMAGFVEIYFKI
jgi:hypothetical protein